MVNMLGGEQLELGEGAPSKPATRRENGGPNIDLVSPTSDASALVGSMTVGTKSSVGADPAPAADTDVASSPVAVPPMQRSAAVPGTGSASAAAAP
jgi:hypothetical protein